MLTRKRFHAPQPLQPSVCEGRTPQMLGRGAAETGASMASRMYPTNRMPRPLERQRHNHAAPPSSDCSPGSQSLLDQSAQPSVIDFCVCRHARTQAQRASSAIAWYASLPDPSEVHVLTAATAGHADCIVTTNLKDFPVSVLEVFGLVALHPGDFIGAQLDLDIYSALGVFKAIRARHQDPTLQS